MKYKCYFDLQGLENPFITGIENYTLNLYNLFRDDKEFLFMNSSLNIEFPKSNLSERDDMLSFFLFLEDVSIYFSPFLPIPQSINAKKIITVHDVIPMIHPEWFPDDLYCLFNNKLRKCYEDCDHIISDSYSTKNDLIKIFNIPRDKITTIHLGKSESFSPKKSNNPSLFIKDLNCFPYILSVCTLEPRKNLQRVIEAFITLKDNNKSFNDIKLVLTGAPGWNNDSIYAIYEQSVYKNDIIFTGYLNVNDLYEIYRYANAFIYPSFYEGFGLPILEAMASGVPVVTSSNSSLTEVGGESVIYVDPSDIDSIADGIIAALFDSRIRDKCISSGLERSKNFSWEKTAKETLDVFKKVIDS